METVGGILADGMGLGKTLTMISTIVRTAEAARLFAENDGDVSETKSDEVRRVASRSTLVIVPSPREFHAPPIMRLVSSDVQAP